MSLGKQSKVLTKAQIDMVSTYLLSKRNGLRNQTIFLLSVKFSSDILLVFNVLFDGCLIEFYILNLNTLNKCINLLLSLSNTHVNII